MEDAKCHDSSIRTHFWLTVPGRVAHSDNLFQGYPGDVNAKGRRGRWWALAAGATGLTMTSIYVGLTISQGDGEWGRIWLFVLLVVLASGFAFAAEVVVDVSTGRELLVISTLMFAVIGIVGFFSIGAPFLVAAVVAAVGSTRLSDAPTNSRRVRGGGVGVAKEPRAGRS